MHLKGFSKIIKNTLLFLVRPGKPQSPDLSPTSSKSLILSYNVPNQMKNFPPGLIQEIVFSNQYEPDEWTKLNVVTSPEHRKVGELYYSELSIYSQ